MTEDTDKKKRSSPNQFSERSLKPIEAEITRKMARIQTLEEKRDDAVQSYNEQISVLQTSVDKARAMLEEFRRQSPELELQEKPPADAR